MDLFCWVIKLFYVLLMLSIVPTIDTRPLKGGGAQRSDLIAGNEFLKLFLEREDLHSGEHQGFGAGGAPSDLHSEDKSVDIATTSKTSSRSTSARSLDNKSHNANAHANEDESKQATKVVTSGSKIVLLEEYDDDDAVVDAVARDIDLKKEKRKDKLNANKTNHTGHHLQHHRKSNRSDEVKIIAVSYSSSSKRASPTEHHSVQSHSSNVNSFSEVPFSNRSKNKTSIQNEKRHPVYQQKYKFHKSQQRTSSTRRPLAVKATARTTTTTKTTSPPARTAATTTPSTSVEFINRSHKSEFSIEEIEPLTMSQQKSSSSSPSSPSNSYAHVSTFYDTDSENSASTNIQNVLAAPLVRALPSKSIPDTGSTNDPDATYHSSAWNTTRISQSQSSSSSSQSHATHTDDNMSDLPASAAIIEDKLLPFQTVIYHDTKEGHGPQSRSISYSSISQNVDDLRAWQKSGILAEAQRNVSESLKPVSQHDSEPAKFYSMPAKMYSVPAKFYSEPAKVYSEPAKVYGEPEKFYSEPAKVYGQPSKFYSEPAKVYSQPAKVYGEPAKTYWPLPPAAASTTTPAPSSTTANGQSPNSGASSSRRPAIVSRIAFGEAQTTKFPTHSEHQTLHTNKHSHTSSRHFPHSSADTPTQPRRVLFNLDKLPYDLLNAPEQSAKHLLEPDLSKHSQTAVTSNLGFGRQRPCLESSSTSVSGTSSASQQQRSSELDQHSNQNAKGLLNRDLVKCVSKYSHSAASSPASAAGRQRHPSFTTERSHIEELYTPTPEQNYEIEESVSVMTNGRAHGVQGIGPTTTTTMTTTSRSRVRGEGASGVAADGAQKQHGSIGALYHSNANANEEDDGGEEAVEENYDESDNDGDADDDNNDGSSSRNKNNNNNSQDDDDSKVAYVVEGRNFRKYRVEEKTDDGFIVGEYGVVDHNDGNLRGVRYTADSTINRSLIQKALLAFLKLK